MDLPFLEKTLRTCLTQPFEITKLFDYLDEIIQTSSQQRRFETFTNKWKVLFQNSKDVMIVNYAGTWTPQCFSSRELNRQEPWNKFVQKYVPTYSECSVNSEEKPEYQPLNFQELVQLSFWKAVYEAFGNRIVTHIFEKCALLFEIEEGFYLIVANSKGVMHSQIKEYKEEAKIFSDNRIALPQLQSKNPYQLPAPVEKPYHLQPKQEVAAADNAISDEHVECLDHEDMEVCENLQDVSHENEPPRKRLKIDKDAGIMIEEVKTGWTVPKPKELQKLIEHRRNFYNTKTSATPSSSSCELNYVLIQKNEDFEPTDKMAVIKQCYTIQVAAPRLPKVWNGLKLPENLKKIAGTNEKINCIVYKISETLSIQLGLLIKRKKRYKKRKLPIASVEEAVSAPQCIHSSASGNEKAVMLYKPVEGQKDVNGSKEFGNMGHATKFEAYIPQTILPISSCLYSKVGRTEWPKSHALSEAANALPENEHDAVIRLIQDIVKFRTCSSTANARLVACLGEHLEKGIVNAFQCVLKSIIETHIKFNDKHKLLKNCLTHWQILYCQKQQKRLLSRKNVSPEETPDKINEKQKSGPPGGIIGEMSENKSQLEPEIIDLITLTNTSSTNFSLSDNVRVLEESQQKPDGMEVDTSSSQAPWIVGSSSKSENRTCKPLNSTIKRRSAEKITKKNVQKHVNGLKTDIPPNCVMQTLKQIFRIMKLDSLLGSLRNKRGFFKFVRKAVILGGMKSALHLGSLMSTLHVEDMPLIEACGNDRIAAEVLAAKVAAWLFKEIILVILKTSFYITECNSSRLQLQFYLMETWKSVSNNMTKQLVEKGALIPQQNGSASGQANSMLRYMPKLNQTLRPLLIKKKAEKELHASDTKDFKAMLYYIDAKINKTRVFVPSTILKVWKNFVTEWKSEGCPKLFYFRTDIRDAYPSVSISKLKEILLDAGGEKGHRMVLKKFKVITAGGRTMDRESIFDDHCKNNWHSGIHSRPCLVMDKEQDRVDNAWKILERAIRVLSKSNDVKLGRRFYKFSHGLPQGWGPSSLLCSIYYGYIDSKMYLPFIESSGRFFLRIVDDYLFITPEPIEISDLNHVMKMGCEKYNIQLNQGKSETNMLVRSNIPISPRFCDTVTFCGWNFCLTCAHVSRDYKKYDGQDLCSTVAFQLKNTESPEHFIRLRGTVITSARLKPIVIDPTINCNRRILLTTFEASTFLSFRFYAICRVLYPTLSVIKEPARAKNVAMSIRMCCGRLAGYVSRNCDMLSSTSTLEVQQCSENCCGRQKISNQGTSESHKPSVPTPSSNLVLNHDSLLFAALIGFRIMLHKHHEVFKKVIPQINRRISELNTKLGSDRIATILSIIDHGKIPQCFDGISIKM